MYSSRTYAQPGGNNPPRTGIRGPYNLYRYGPFYSDCPADSRRTKYDRSSLAFSLTASWGLGIMNFVGMGVFLAPDRGRVAPG